MDINVIKASGIGMAINNVHVDSDTASLPTGTSDKATQVNSTETINMTYIDLMHKDKFDMSISEEAVLKAIEKANKAISGVSKKFEYSVHKSTGDIVVKVLNAETNEVIREIPPEKLLDIVDKLQEISGAVGTIIDEKR